MKRTTKNRLKARLLEDQGERCANNECQEYLDLNTAVLDHKIPVCRGGTDEPSNFWLLCRWCNSLKGILTHHEFIVMESAVRYGGGRLASNGPHEVVEHPGHCNSGSKHWPQIRKHPDFARAFGNDPDEAVIDRLINEEERRARHD